MVENDDSANPTDAAPDAGGRPRAVAGREMLIQLQQMIDTLALQAAPVAREVAAKAAELAAVAGEKAGPLAYRAAGATENLGRRVAARSKVMAADLRKPRPEGEEAEGSATEEPGDPGTAAEGPGESVADF